MRLYIWCNRKVNESGGGWSEKQDSGEQEAKRQNFDRTHEGFRDQKTE